MTVTVWPGDEVDVPVPIALDVDFSTYTVEVSLGAWETVPGEWFAPHSKTFAADGKSAVAKIRVGAGFLLPTANTYFPWWRVKDLAGNVVGIDHYLSRVVVKDTTGTPIGTQSFVESVVAGTNVTVDSTDPRNPVVSSSGGGSGGVTSFQTRTGAVTLTKGDVTGTGLAAADVGAATTAQGAKADSADQAGFIAADKTRLAGTSGTNTGDQVLPTTLPPNGAAGGDLTGTYPNPTLGAAGTAGTYGDASHVPQFTTDAKGRVTAVTATSILIASGAVTGLGTLATQSGTFSGTSSGTNTGDETTATIKTKLGITTLSGSNTGDQVIPTALPPNGAASGDLTGTYPAPNVAKINGTALSGLATGLLKNTTTTGVPSIAAAADVPTVAAGGTGALSATDGSVTNSRAPSGAAGGDLAGTFPNPTLATGIVSAGTTGDATHSLTLTVDAKGRVTGVTSNAIAIPESAVTNLVTDLAAKATITESVNTVGTSGSAQTIPAVTSSTISRITLSANCTLTFPTATAGTSFTLVLVQDGTGSRTITWPASAKWAGGTAPTLSTGASKVDYLTFTCTDGSTWSGFVAGKDVR